MTGHLLRETSSWTVVEEIPPKGIIIREEVHLPSHRECKGMGEVK